MRSLNTMPALVLRNTSASAALRSRNGAIARFLTSMRDQIEGVEDCSARSPSRRNSANPVAPAHQHSRNRAGRRRLAKSWAAFDHGPIPAACAAAQPAAA
jgi:hypothetical protein